MYIAQLTFLEDISHIVFLVSDFLLSKQITHLFALIFVLLLSWEKESSSRSFEGILTCYGRTYLVEIKLLPWIVVFKLTLRWLQSLVKEFSFLNFYFYAFALVPSWWKSYLTLCAFLSIAVVRKQSGLYNWRSFES